MILGASLIIFYHMGLTKLMTVSFVGKDHMALFCWDIGISTGIPEIVQL